MRAAASQDPAREPEAPLGGLIGIGGGADDEGMAGEARGVERAREHLGDVGLDQDALLERLPGGQRLGVWVMVRCRSTA